MGLSYVYKRFTPQDFAVIPFNAHKQYNFTSASSAEFSVNHYSSSYTSESISIYSSASSNPLGVFDPINNIKYNQVDHLFYRNYKKNPSRKKDLTNHNKQRRDLYEKTNILSIPSGLYGYQIRKGSFYLSSSTHEIVDDSFGNLLISGTNINDYPVDPQENVFRLGPIKGFKKYDLSIHDGYAVFNTFYDKFENKLPNPLFNDGTQHIQPHIKNVERKFWRQGQKNAAAFNTYTTNNKLNIYNPYEDLDEDDSYFSTPLQYNNVTFKKSSLGNTNHKFPTINFNSATSSFIKINEIPRLNFNTQEEFCISFYIKPDATGSQNDISDSEKRYILAKSTTKTIPGSGNLSGSNSNLIDTSAGPQFPFEIYLQSQSLYFARSDGDTINIINGEITASGGTCQRTSHILCQLSSSKMQIWFDGTKIAETTNTLIKSTKNKANLYIGSKGPTTSIDDQNTNITSSHYFNGELGNINIWNRAFNINTIKKISSSVNASPYIGDIFYNSGIATITHPNFYDILSNGPTGIINTLQFQGSHLIYEHEYQCTLQEYEYNHTLNTSVRDQAGSNPYKLEGFTSNSFFKPFVTTIGLYNDAFELLAIAKLGSPIRCSDETDTTFVVRFDS